MALNTHMTHLEDAVFLLGVPGTRQSIEFLTGMRDTLNGTNARPIDTSVKWDGAPAIFLGRHPESKEFFVAKKSLFNKTPLYYTSVKAIRETNDLGIELKRKFELAFNGFKDSGIDHIIQGDFLFDSSDIKTATFDGESFITFHPNTIVYTVPAVSDLAKKIKAAKMGIVWHTTYKGRSLATLTNTFGVTMPRCHSSVWQVDAMYRDVSGSATLTKFETANLTKILTSAGANFRKIPKRVFDIINHPDIAQHATTYTNSFIRANTTPSRIEAAANFLPYIKAKFLKEADKRKTDKGKGAVMTKFAMIRDPLQAIPQTTLLAIFSLYYDLQEAKNMLVKKLDSAAFMKTMLKTTDGWKPTGQEGYVAIDAKGTSAVKLVDRLDFSYANFSKDVIKGWESDARS
tara:strand:+ start:125 stop:1330 length:1206 start_codon:yes stop_codon:yes gene_type:complete